MTGASSHALGLHRTRSRPGRISWTLLWPRWRSRLLVALLALFVLAFLALLVEIALIVKANEAIRRLKTNHDVPVAVDAPAELLLARVSFLLDHDRIDEVRPYVQALDKQDTGRLAAIAHYDLANSRLRQAFDLITASKLDSAGPFVVLSREEYRRALTLSPDDWDAKFNFDVASRLIRDFPMFERTSGDDVKADRKKIWTDIPGKPQGLP
ncbi:MULTISPECIES: MxaK protein [unclassified Bradyrhizobium]|uniref:MxaK protein n=1 Tax=unclassified Bradyrhizobium TaxID=2631580 RepID=UPI0028E86ADC|nr:MULTISPECIES: MxaK protein [unclassified Bradyrhizobium]